MKVFDRRVVITSFILNLVLIGVIVFYWRPIAQTINYQFTQALSCQEVMTGYTAQYKTLEKELAKIEFTKIEEGTLSDDERLVLQKAGVMDSRAGIIYALCEAPLTEQTPFDPLPTITEVGESNESPADTPVPDHLEP